jgi:hypothetical protein
MVYKCAHTLFMQYGAHGYWYTFVKLTSLVIPGYNFKLIGATVYNVQSNLYY